MKFVCVFSEKKTIHMIYTVQFKSIENEQHDQLVKIWRFGQILENSTMIYCHNRFTIYTNEYGVNNNSATTTTTTKCVCYFFQYLSSSSPCFFFVYKHIVFFVVEFVDIFMVEWARIEDKMYCIQNNNSKPWTGKHRAGTLSNHCCCCCFYSSSQENIYSFYGRRYIIYSFNRRFIRCTSLHPVYYPYPFLYLLYRWFLGLSPLWKQ